MHTPVYCGRWITGSVISECVYDYVRGLVLTCSRKDTDVSSVLQHVSCPQKKWKKGVSDDYHSFPTPLSCFFCLPVIHEGLCRGQGVENWLLVVVCVLLFLQVFSTRRQLSKPCLAVPGSVRSLRFHFSPLLQHSHLLDLSRKVKYSTVGLIGVCLLFVWICFSLRPLGTHRLHNARICH